ncbi:hypothetical protein F4861DRAFT_518075 [Xylaria intraflava]|nr:hypothetical protein F4861DRAFT_518075 [Xylaria intraflava]
MDEWHSGSESDEPDQLQSCYGSTCSLCRFEVVPGENIVAVLDDGKISTEFRFGPVITRDDSLSAVLVHCQGSCTHSYGWAFACHVQCFRFTGYKPSMDLFRALAYELAPSAAVQKQRYKWLQSSFVLHLKLGSRRLPHELSLLIAQYCIREYAIAATWLQTSGPNTYSVGVLGGIWACYVMIDGVRYISSFANKPSANAQLILGIEEAADTHQIYVAEDHLGIRRVCFRHSSPPCSNDSASELWWRTFSVHDGTRIRVHADGLKIRRLECTPSDAISELATNIAWLTPEPRPDLIRLRPISAFPRTHLRMASTVCNDPRTTAYSASWLFHVFHLHAHIDGEDSKYNSVTLPSAKHMIWLYMPINKGEYISQIWKRAAPIIHNHDLALLMVTNKGRTMMLGAQLRYHWAPCNWTLLYSSDGSASRIFFEACPWGISKLGFESPEPARQGRLPFIPPPTSPYPEATVLNQYTYSSAALESVVALTPCEVKVAGKPSIIGLLFRYSDGSRACLGQFRLDWATAPLVVDGSSKLWLTFDMDDGGPFVDSVGVSHPPKPMSPRCLHISWVGKLEWWAGCGQCKVYYQNQASLITKC